MSEDEQRIQYSGDINESSALKQSHRMNELLYTNQIIICK